MKSEDQKNLNNLYHRYQMYDNDGTKYAYDIYYLTLNGGRQMKAKRDSGVDKFRKHIDELMQNFDDVCCIEVSDYNGKSARAKEINNKVEIYLMDIKNMETPKVLIREKIEPEKPKTDIFKGLSGIFAGTSFEGLGELAPYIKNIDDKHTIDRIREKNEEQSHTIEELRRKCENWEQKYETLNREYGQLQDDADDMEDELDEYRARDKKQDGWVSMIGLAGASIAKNFIRQNPSILSGIIPAEQLAGMFADDESAITSNSKSELNEEEQSRLDDATTVFEWLQTLEPDAFSQVISVISVLRKDTGYADHILSYLSGKRDKSLSLMNS